MNSRAKGCRFERTVRDILRDAGFMKARRGMQFCGSPDSPDVVCPELPNIHIEAKAVERGNLYDWVRQAQRDAGTKIPTVWHKRNNEPVVVIMLASDWLNLIKETDQVKGDRLGTVCACGGHYAERDVQDDIHGTLHCDRCGKCVRRHG